MAGEFLNPVGNVQTFSDVVDRVQRMPNMDPKVAFRTATPGILSGLFQRLGPWEGRGDWRVELPGITEGARAVGRDERMRLGTDKIGHIVAKLGFELAGHSQSVHPHDFAFGMTAERARDLAAKPILDFNDEVAHILVDIITSGDYSGSLTNDFAWSALDLAGNTASQALLTDDANQVPNVYANDSQTFLWPLRDGTQTSTGHDHLADTGAVWSAANAKTQADLITEHPGNGRVRAFVGSTVATAVSAAKKSDLGSTELVRPFVDNEFTAGKGSDFANAVPIGMYDGIEYHHMVDLPASGVLMVAANKTPFHVHIGAMASPGMAMGKGGWMRNHATNDELLGMTWGWRDYLSAGMIDPTAASYKVHDS